MADVEGANAEAREDLRRHIVHFAPGRARLAIMLGLAAVVTLLAYGLIIRETYFSIRSRVEAADAVDGTLRTLPNYPIGPAGAKGEMRFAAKKLDDAAAFEVLKAWGVFGRQIQLGPLLDHKPAVANETKMLGALTTCYNMSEANRASYILLQCVIKELGGSTDSGIDNKKTVIDSNCLWPLVSRALTSYPGSRKLLSQLVSERLAGIDVGKACPLPNDHITFVHAFDWWGDTRDDAGVARSILMATGRLPKDGEGTPKDSRAQYKVPNWALFDSIELRFVTEIISRIQSDEEVKKAQSWLVLWRGPEQFMLLFTGIVLLLLLFDRARQRSRVAYEADVVLAELDRALASVLAETDKAKRTAETRALADKLAAKTDGRPPADCVSRGAEDRLSSVRTNSVVLFMAEKAVRRIVMEPRQPELFRHTCDSINDEVERSGWILRFASRALPAIGFIGTVRGIMLALPAARNLFGTTGAAQAAALNDVIEPLGLAFATTLIALVIGLITGFIGDRQVAREQLLLSRIEDALIDRIDPAEA